MKPPKNVIYILIILLGTLLFYKICSKRGSEQIVKQPKKSEHAVPEKTWTRPVVPIRGITKRPPVPKEELPIPKKEVAKTIAVPLPDGRELTFVIDKKGDVYKTKDFPKEIKPVVTEWRPPVFAIGTDYGFSLAYSGKTYFCLSVNVFNISERVYFGGDIGVNIEDVAIKNWLLGAAARYRIWREKPVFLTGGWDFIGRQVYVGLSLMW
jgi:hypothetical protein